MQKEPLTADLQGIFDHLRSNYVPAYNYVEASMRLNTQELYDKFLLMFPVEGFTPTLLFGWMRELGYQYQDSGNLNIEWMLKKI
jgi:hypothetical protein